MEMGSGSLTESGGSSTNSSTESLNGLKFGKKIYFEDAVAAGTGGSGGGGATIGASPKSGPAISSSSGPGRKARVGGVVQGAQPPRCQVEGCKVDLSDSKAYYSRHKVCGMHSKSPKVIVAGLEQRFCQQCSRFHQLPEFDQGKRSCRRRLAGHNERRRKPPAGSLLSSRYGMLSSSIIERSSRGGSFIMDFTAYPRLSARSSEHIPENQTTARSLQHPWQNNSENPPPEVFLQGSPGGTGFSSTAIAPGECFMGVGDSSCALSLLSNQPWGSRNRASSLGVDDMMNTEGSSLFQQTAPHAAVVNPYSNVSCVFKGNDSGSSSNEMPPHLGLGQTEPVDSQSFGRLELSQQNRRQFMELEQSRAYDTSMQHIHWSL
ncbi:hypothetical protein PTKIN_Ptkin06aG0083800 [Pterospermum kingtungense]